MKKTLLLSLLVAASTIVTAQAADQITLLAYGPSGGGELTILPSWSPAADGYDSATKNVLQNGTFQSFCLEAFEHIDTHTPYFVMGSQTTLGISPSPIPLNAGTAWLYKEFAQGNLAGYDYVGRTTQAALQNEIWYFMGGQVGLNPIFDALVNANVALPQAPNTDMDIWVINVGPQVAGNNANGTYQDILYMWTPGVPDGGLTIALLGMGLTGIGAISRRVRK